MHVHFVAFMVFNLILDGVIYVRDFPDHILTISETTPLFIPNEHF